MILQTLGDITAVFGGVFFSPCACFQDGDVLLPCAIPFASRKRRFVIVNLMVRDESRKAGMELCFQGSLPRYLSLSATCPSFLKTQPFLLFLLFRTGYIKTHLPYQNLPSALPSSCINPPTTKCLKHFTSLGACRGNSGT